MTAGWTHLANVGVSIRNPNKSVDATRRVFVGVDSTCSTQITDLEGGTRYAKFGVRFFAGPKNELK